MARAKQSKEKAAPAPSESPGGDGTGTPQRSKRRKSGGDRPTTYTEALGLEICERLIAGETLDSICRDAHMPDSRITVFRWRRANPAFDEAYLAARGDQLDALGDQVLEIAETEKDLQRAKIKLDARRIVMSRLASRYGPAINAQKPDEPFDIAGEIQANRKRIEALIAEVGHERAQRIQEDATIERAINPDPRLGEALVRAQQRAATHILEERKRALFAETDGKVH